MTLDPNNNIIISTDLSFKKHDYEIRAFTESGSVPGKIKLSITVINCLTEKIEVKNPILRFDFT